MRLAAAQIDARGGVLGRRVKLFAADSRSKPQALAREVRQLIERRVWSRSAA
jgi:ABC-type branched-subunit amino acid transport system substrate-binding protein